MDFRLFSQSLAQIEQVSARLQITAYLAELFSQLHSDECPAAFNLLQGQLLPPYMNMEFQLSEKMVVRALSRLADQENLFAAQSGGQAQAANLFGEEDLSFLEAQVRKLISQSGDLGLATESLLQLRLLKQTNSSLNNAPPLSLNQVYQSLLTIAQEAGAGSQDRKLQLLQDLLRQLDPLSARFVVRIIIGKLRLGFSLMTILDALSWTMTGGKSESELLEDTFQKKADLAQLAAHYLFIPTAERRQQELQNYQLEAGVPVVAALCQRLNSAADIIAKMTEVYAEPKYDGMRIQIHFKRAGGEESEHFIRAFTRNLEDVSHMFPELQQLSLAFPSTQTLIIDSEAVGYNPQTGELVAFQETITRKRKHEVAAKAESTPVRFFVFDVLLYNEQSLLGRPLTDRKEILAEIFTDDKTFVHSPFIVTTDADELHQYHHQQLAKGLEGVVIKQVSSVYQSGRKGWSWVKIKEEEGTRGKLNDTLDLVVMGLYAGKGKRHGFGVGAFLVGLRSNNGDEILTLSKIGTGLTDDQFRELKQRAEPLRVSEIPSTYKLDKALASPDIWLEPSLIVEIAADEITTSNLHTSGFSLRFPRLIKWRDDKDLSTTTSLEELTTIKIGT